MRPSPSPKPDALNLVANFAFDTAGNVTSISDPRVATLTWYPDHTTGSQQTYTYDSENRLVTAAINGSTPSIRYDYDALGRRVKKTLLNTETPSLEYLLDGDEEIAEYEGTTLRRRYITGPAIGWVRSSFFAVHRTDR